MHEVAGSTPVRPLDSSVWIEHRSYKPTVAGSTPAPTTACNAELYSGAQAPPPESLRADAFHADVSTEAWDAEAADPRPGTHLPQVRGVVSNHLRSRRGATTSSLSGACVFRVVSARGDSNYSAAALSSDAAPRRRALRPGQAKALSVNAPGRTDPAARRRLFPDRMHRQTQGGHPC